MRGLWFIVAVVSLTSSAALAQPSDQKIHLPFEGYYRVGRCMPVFIDSNPDGMTLRIAGAVPTEVQAGRTGVVPLLMLADSSESLAAQPLRALSPDQVLVGSTIDDISGIASELFPNRPVVRVKLTPGDALPGPRLAWEALDLVVLDGDRDPQQWQALLEAGTTVAFYRRGADPGFSLPWEQHGDFWVLRPHLAGPVGAFGGEVAYLPSSLFTPEPSALMRKSLICAGILVALAAMGVWLAPRRRVVVVAPLTALVAIGAIEGWRGQIPRMQSASGEIRVTNPSFEQQDQWQFFTSHAPATATVPVREFTRPIFVDPAQAERASVVLHSGATIEWSFSLKDNARLAFQTRRFIFCGFYSIGFRDFESIPAQRFRETNSPLSGLARQMYLHRDAVLKGDFPPLKESTDTWPGVWIEEAPATGN